MPLTFIPYNCHDALNKIKYWIFIQNTSFDIMFSVVTISRMFAFSMTVCIRLFRKTLVFPVYFIVYECCLFSKDASHIHTLKVFSYDWNSLVRVALLLAFPGMCNGYRSFRCLHCQGTVFLLLRKHTLSIFLPQELVFDAWNKRKAVSSKGKFLYLWIIIFDQILFLF